MAARVIFVKTCQRFRPRREACEATWAGGLRDMGIPVYFVEGGHGSEQIDGNLIRTFSGDDYDSNSFKVRDGLRLLMDAVPFDHVFICDDNTFVHWLRWLDFYPQSDFIGLHNPPKLNWCHGGAGWWMSKYACNLFIAGIKRKCSWDDRLASEILVEYGIEIENHPELFAQWDERVSADNRLITSHNVEPEEMRSLYLSTYDL